LWLAFCELFPPAVAATVSSAGVASCSDGGVTCEAHSAAKLPEVRGAEFTRLPKPSAGAAATKVIVMFMNADSRAEVTVKSPS